MSAATKRTHLGSVLEGLEPLKAVVQGWVKEAVLEAEAERQQRLPPRAVEPVEHAYMTRAQVVAHTGYSKRTIERRIAEGVLHASGPRGDRIKRADVDRMMEADAAKGPARSDGSGDEEFETELDRLVNHK